MPKIKRFFECLIPVTVCNLECEYCYIIQRTQRTKKIPELKYSPEVIGKALTQKRLGGICYFSICGAGETFVPEYLIDIIFQLLRNGHYVNVTTNGTITKRIHELESFPAEYCKRLHISFSFHYLELERKNLVDVFFDNIKYVKSLGCSFIVQVNLYDQYIPHLKKIKKLCFDNVGAAPQLIVTRKEKSLTKKIELLSTLSENEYRKTGAEFQSPLFEFTNNTFNIKRNEFCYAGSWAYTLNLNTGIMKRCYASCIFQNVFENIEKPILDLAVGNKCGSLYCLNSSHFMSLGTIPELTTPTYYYLRNREGTNWYSETMAEFLSSKLDESNSKYPVWKKIICNLIGIIDNVAYKCWRTYRNRS